MWGCGPWGAGGCGIWLSCPLLTSDKGPRVFLWSLSVRLVLLLSCWEDGIWGTLQRSSPVSIPWEIRPTGYGRGTHISFPLLATIGPSPFPCRGPDKTLHGVAESVWSSSIWPFTQCWVLHPHLRSILWPPSLSFHQRLCLVIFSPLKPVSPYCFRHLSEVSERNCRLWGGREGILVGPETRRAWIWWCWA